MTLRTLRSSEYGSVAPFLEAREAVERRIVLGVRVGEELLPRLAVLVGKDGGDEVLAGAAGDGQRGQCQQLHPTGRLRRLPPVADDRVGAALRGSAQLLRERAPRLRTPGDARVMGADRVAQEAQRLRAIGMLRPPGDRDDRLDRRQRRRIDGALMVDVAPQLPPRLAAGVLIADHYGVQQRRQISRGAVGVLELLPPHRGDGSERLPDTPLVEVPAARDADRPAGADAPRVELPRLIVRACIKAARHEHAAAGTVPSQ